MGVLGDARIVGYQWQVPVREWAVVMPLAWVEIFFLNDLGFDGLGFRLVAGCHVLFPVRFAFLLEGGSII